MTKFTVVEYGTTFDTYEVEADSAAHAEDLVSGGKGKLIKAEEEHDFFDTTEVTNA